MKTKVSLFLAFISVGIIFSSCKKQELEKTKIQTIDIVLDMNKSYQFSFGPVHSDLSITKQSDAFLVSELETINEAMEFKYMPKLNFVGVDEVQITLNGEDEKEHHHQNGNHHKNPVKKMLHHGAKHECHKHDDDDKIIYIFRFTVNKTTAASTSALVIGESQN
jgi:hypothetical protein